MTATPHPPADPPAPAPPAGADPAATRGIFTRELLDRCMSCGFCLPACPTYALTRDEASSPRGRITLMRALETGGLAEDDPTLLEQSSFCLGCRACEPVCPAGVRYGELLEEWRDHQWRGRRWPALARLLMLAVDRAWRLRPLGLVRRHARTRPGPAGPVAAEAAAAKRGAVAAGRPQLVLGCFERALYPGVSRAAQALIPDLEIPAGQGCCGALHAHNGELERGRELARELGDALPGVVVTTAGGCAAHLAGVLGRDRVREVSQWLAADDLPLRPLRVDGRPARLTLQDSCHLRNGLGVWRQPRALLERLGEYVEMPDAAGCCGAAGSYSLLRPRDSAAVLAPKLDAVRRLGVDYVVVVNPGCYRQWQQGLKRRRSPTRAVHLVELLAAARTRPAPARRW